MYSGYKTVSLPVYILKKIFSHSLKGDELLINKRS